MKSGMTRRKLSPDVLRKQAYGFQPSRILLTAFELGIFTALGSGERSSNQVAAGLRTDPRATDRLMNALCAMELLTKKKGKFRNAPLADRFLVDGKPERMSGLMHAANLWHTWGTLTEAVRRGTSVLGRRPVGERDQDWLTSFIEAMHYRAVRQAGAVVGAMDLAGVKRVLDVGGGSGAYAMAFAGRKRGIHATVFDLPDVIRLTRSYLEEGGFTENVETVAGDYRTDDLGSDFDLVFLSAIIHSNSAVENRKLIRKCSGALRQKGRVVVQDFIMDEDRTTPPDGAFFALNMLVGTEAGDTYTESEVGSWMAEAGLTRIRRKETSFGVSQIIGSRK